ncbi:hypothetical protein AVEN_16008-1 [Araneus ventricosus]|uniref:Uncharacterized protein n=1 Tax=Araneus ventricosus TaxID=182803 RepID=A0A4Y2V7G9_ARAVE|nr:hypothetical protein AVEN_16008-1 [Araneus ventricosus]
MEEGIVKGTNKPPDISPLDKCRELQRADDIIRSFDPHFARARKAMGEAPPLRGLQRGSKRIGFSLLYQRDILQNAQTHGQMPDPCCNKHIIIEDESDTDAKSCKDEDRISLDGESERASTPPATTETMEIDFQMVSQRKAARRPSPAKNLPPVTVTNRYEKLDDTPAPRETREFPGTINNFLYGYIIIQAASDDNRFQIHSTTTN